MKPVELDMSEPVWTISVLVKWQELKVNRVHFRPLCDLVHPQLCLTESESLGLEKKSQFSYGALQATRISTSPEP